MADWSGSARTNYFRVNDLKAFEASLAPFSNLHIQPENDPKPAGQPQRVCVLETDGYGWPSTHYDEETDEDIEVDLAALIAEHLIDGEVAVLMETGAEKLRYLTGMAVAVNAAGETRTVSLEDIYDLAAQLNPSGPVTAAAS